MDDALFLNHEMGNRNVVSTVNLGCKLELKTIALHARNAEYNPKVRIWFCGVTLEFLFTRGENTNSDLLL